MLKERKKNLEHNSHKNITRNKYQNTTLFDEIDIPKPLFIILNVQTVNKKIFLFLLIFFTAINKHMLNTR